MKHYFRFNLLSISILAFCLSCTASKMLVSNRTPTSIKQIDYLLPYSHISLIEKKNTANFSEELSASSQEVLDSLLNTKRTFKVKRRLAVDDEFMNVQIEREIAALMEDAVQNKNVQQIQLTPTLDSLMRMKESDFTLAVFATGFTRGKGNYGKQIAKGIGVGLLTLGMVTPVPVKANTTLHFLLCDRQNNNIALYRNSFLEKDPLDAEALSKQIDKVLLEYFVRR